MEAAATITGVKFHISTNNQQATESAVVVTERSSFASGVPIPHGIADPGFGPATDSYKCTTCNKNQKECQKHNGIFKLSYPIPDPKLIGEIGLWLKVICPWCGQLIINPENIPGFMNAPNRLKFLVLHLKLSLAIVQKKKPEQLPSIIPQCTNPSHEPKFMPIYTPDKINNKLFRVYRYEFGLDKSALMHPHIIKMIFQQIPEYVVRLMKRTIHPINYIRDNILIPPMNVRAGALSITHSTQAKDTAMHYLSTLVQDGLKVLPPQIDEQSIDTAMNFQLELMNQDPRALRYADRSNHLDIYSIFQTGNSAIKKNQQQTKSPGLAGFLLGKNGLIRKERCGNRKHSRGRAVIIAVPDLKIDEILVPIYMAERMFIIEIVTDHNFMNMYKYLRNGLNYPGCFQIEKADGTLYVIGKNKDTFTLDVGDKVYRQLITGDKECFNRQPSLALSSFASFNIIVNTDPNVYAIGMNPAVCRFFNADFDGDQMTVIPVNTEAARAEFKLNSVKNFYINEQDSQPRIFLSQDDLTLIAELTRSTTRFTRYEAITLLEGIIIPEGIEWHNQPIFDKWGTGPDDMIYKGSEIMSMILPKINYTRRPTIYKSSDKGPLDLHESDLKVVIEDGIVKSGIFDKAIIGSSTESLFHTVYSIYDIDTTLHLLSNIQMLAKRYSHIRNFTISPLDFHIENTIQVEIQDRVRSVLTEGVILEQQLYNGEIIPPRGTSISEYYEQQSIQNLQHDYVDLIIKSIGTYSHLIRMIVYGAKGSVGNLNSICGAVGQMLVGPNRPIQSFTNYRANVFTHQFDQGPLALGFIPDNNVNGLQPKDYFVSSMNGRDTITKKAIETAQAGYMGRMFMRVLENLVVDYFMRVRVGNKCIQLAFGDCGYDPRLIKPITIPGITLSHEEFKKEYHYIVPKSIDGNDSDTNHTLQKVFDHEYDTLLQNRDRYIKSMIDLEIISGEYNGNIDQQKLPVDIRVSLDSIQKNKLDVPVDIMTLLQMRDKVEKMIKRLPYLQFASKFWDNVQNQMDVPDYVLSFHDFFLHYIQVMLASTKIQYYTPETIDELLIIIQLKFRRSLVQPGEPIGAVSAMSLGEVFTQSSLNSIHGVGAKRLTSYTTKDTQEFLKATDTTGSNSAKMIMRLKPEYEKDRIQAHLIASKIQLSALREYIQCGQIFFEEFANPRHPKYIHEIEIYEKFKKNNLRTIPQTEPFCFRLELSIEKLLDRGITVLEIVNKLQIMHPEVFIVSTYETDKKFGPILRIHPIKGKSTFIESVKNLEKYYRQFTSTIIRGIPNIEIVMEVKTHVHVWNAKLGKVEEDDIYIITTRGSNMLNILEIEEIDHNLIQASSMVETQNTLGLAAARTRIMVEFSKITPNINKHYFSMIASHMISTGNITGISISGQISRDPNNVFGNMATAFATPIMLNAAINEKTNMFYGASAPVIMGQNIIMGTNYFECCVDVDMLKNNKDIFKSNKLVDVLDRLMD
jgi:DNA-directed RNA polymerase beta' subunit